MTGDRERMSDQGRTAGEVENVEKALACADSGDAGHWPTAAGILADEVRRLRALHATLTTRNYEVVQQYVFEKLTQEKPE